MIILWRVTVVVAKYAQLFEASFRTPMVMEVGTKRAFEIEIEKIEASHDG